MKLQCEVSVVGKRHELHVPGNRMAVDDDAVEHDAMAAQALLQAIDDWHEKNGTGPDEDVYPESAVAFIEQRAAEILAGWMGEDRE